MTELSWNEAFRFQERSGYCGPAVLQMILLKSGIEKSQKEIARYVYKSWIGTPQQLMLAYLSKFFKIVNYKTNAKSKDIAYHLNKGNIVVVNWWDDISGCPGGGHYSIISEYKNRIITLVDPSNERKGIWFMPFNEFEKVWWDTLETHNKIWIAGYLLWVDQKTKIIP